MSFRPVDEEIRELVRGLRFLLAGLDDPGGSAAGTANRGFPVDWETWLETAYRARLRRAVQRSGEAVLSHDVAAVVSQDRDLDGWSGWTDSQRERSLLLGRRILAVLSGVRTARLVDRVRQAVESGSAPGHGPVLFGVLAGVYNAPLLTALTGYACCEWIHLRRQTGDGGIEGFFGSEANKALYVENQQFLLRDSGSTLRVVGE